MKKGFRESQSLCHTPISEASLIGSREAANEPQCHLKKPKPRLLTRGQCKDTRGPQWENEDSNPVSPVPGVYVHYCQENVHALACIYIKVYM